MANGKLSSNIIKLLRKKYKRPLGTRVGDSKKISQMLKKGASIPTYMASKGGHVKKRTKKKTKKS
tara:strand:+ start:2406 stop:2600 length:195 start_codon:yes stop_codon:yes gene_type:complete